MAERTVRAIVVSGKIIRYEGGGNAKRIYKRDSKILVTPDEWEAMKDRLVLDPAAIGGMGTAEDKAGIKARLNQPWKSVIKTADEVEDLETIQAMLEMEKGGQNRPSVVSHLTRLIEEFLKLAGEGEGGEADDETGDVDEVVDDEVEAE